MATSRKHADLLSHDSSDPGQDDRHMRAPTHICEHGKTGSHYLLTLGGRKGSRDNGRRGLEPRATETQ